MGVVFQARDPQLERLVALKAMLPGMAATASARQRFLREARAAAAVKHDHIITIYQVGEDRGVPFLAMELLHGEPLDRRLRRQGSLPVAEVLRIGREVAEGLAAAHEGGLIHRDIKPANIWLEGSRARVKILDFGLARAAADGAQLTHPGAIVGTPAFMAPEQVHGRAADARCDLFSLGCVLYQMATGRLPFEGSDTVSTLMAVASQDPRPPRQVNPGVPREVSDLVMHLLAKDPAGRPPSAAAVAEALAALERAEAAIPAVVAVPVPPLPKADTPAGPRPTATARPRGAVTSPGRVAPAVVTPKPSAGSTSRTLLACGCVALGVALLIGGGAAVGVYWLVAQGGPRLVEALKGEIEKQKGWDEVARFWKPPPADAGPDRLFPRRFEECRLVGDDTQADIPELNIQVPGFHATYQSVQGRMEICVYRASALEREALYRRALERLNPPKEDQDGLGPEKPPAGPDRSTYRFLSGSGESPRIIYRLGPPSRNGILWWDKGWLFVVRTTGGGDAAEFFKRYLAALSGQEAEPAAAPQ
jgi:hypothetical protein